MNKNYNSASQPQHKLFACGKFAFDIGVSKFLKNVAEETLILGDTIRILDAGCSHGGNSNLMLKYILPNFLKLVDQDKSIEVYHCDLECNNWTTTFNTLNHSEDRYSKVLPDRIYNYGVGKTVVGPLLPSNKVDFMCMMNIIQWSCEIINCKSKDLILGFDVLDSATNKLLYGELIIDLTNRIRELKKGGLIVANVVHKHNPHISKGANLFKKALNDMVKDEFESIQSDEIESVVPLYGFEVNEFKDFIDNNFKNVKINCYEPFQTDCPFQNHDVESFTRDFIRFHLGYCEPTILSSLNGSSERKSKIINEMVRRMEIELRSNRKSYSAEIYSSMIVLEKL